MGYSEADAWKLAERWVYQGAFQPRNTLPPEIRSKVILIESGQQANANTGQLPQWKQPEVTQIKTDPITDFNNPPTLQTYSKVPPEQLKKNAPIDEGYLNPIFTQKKNTITSEQRIGSTLMAKDRYEQAVFLKKGYASYVLQSTDPYNAIDEANWVQKNTKNIYYFNPSKAPEGLLKYNLQGAGYSKEEANKIYNYSLNKKEIVKAQLTDIGIGTLQFAKGIAEFPLSFVKTGLTSWNVSKGIKPFSFGWKQVSLLPGANVPLGTSGKIAYGGLATAMIIGGVGGYAKMVKTSGFSLGSKEFVSMFNPIRIPTRVTTPNLDFTKNPLKANVLVEPLSKNVNRYSYVGSTKNADVIVYGQGVGTKIGKYSFSSGYSTIKYNQVTIRGGGSNINIKTIMKSSTFDNLPIGKGKPVFFKGKGFSIKPKGFSSQQIRTISYGGREEGFLNDVSIITSKNFNKNIKTFNFGKTQTGYNYKPEGSGKIFYLKKKFSYDPKVVDVEPSFIIKKDYTGIKERPTGFYDSKTNIMYLRNDLNVPEKWYNIGHERGHAYGIFKKIPGADIPGKRAEDIANLNFNKIYSETITASKKFVPTINIPKVSSAKTISTSSTTIIPQPIKTFTPQQTKLFSPTIKKNEKVLSFSSNKNPTRTKTREYPIISIANTLSVFSGSYGQTKDEVIPRITPISRVTPSSATRNRTRTLSPLVPSVPLIIGGGIFNPNPNKPVTPPIFFPSLNFDESGMFSSVKKGKKIKIKYVPSYDAFLFKIRGRKPKGIESGLRTRPITKQWSKEWIKNITI